MIWKWNEHSQCLNVLLASVTFKFIPVLISEGTFYLLLIHSAGTFPGLCSGSSPESDEKLY